MLKFCALLLLLPLSTFAEDSCTQASCEKVFHVRENHPKLAGLEVELEDGQVMSINEFLSNISEEDTSGDVQIFGGEVPWPVVGGDKEDKKEEEEK